MNDNNEYSKPPDAWISPINVIEKNVYSFVEKMTGIMSDPMVASVNVPLGSSPGEVVIEGPHLGKNGIGSITHVDKFSSVLSEPGPFYTIEKATSSFEIGQTIDTTSSFLNVTASMSESINGFVQKYSILTEGTLELTHSDPKIQGILKGQNTIEIPGQTQHGINSLNVLQGNALSFNNLLETSYNTMKLSADMFKHQIEVQYPHWSEYNKSIQSLNVHSTEIYDNQISVHQIDPNGLLFKAPIVEPYIATQASAVMVGLNDNFIERYQVKSTDSLIDSWGSDVGLRLKKIDPALKEAYDEGISAIKSKHRGWNRLASVSFRTLYEHLLRHLAPDTELDSYYDDKTGLIVNGEFSRNSRLRYIHRDMGIDSYAKMTEQSIKLAEAIFYPLNANVHRLVIPTTDKQMRVLCRQIDSVISVILEASDN